MVIAALDVIDALFRRQALHDIPRARALRRVIRTERAVAVPAPALDDPAVARAAAVVVPGEYVHLVVPGVVVVVVPDVVVVRDLILVPGRVVVVPGVVVVQHLTLVARDGEIVEQRVRAVGCRGDGEFDLRRREVDAEGLAELRPLALRRRRRVEREDIDVADADDQRRVAVIRSVRCPTADFAANALADGERLRDERILRGEAEVEAARLRRDAVPTAVSVRDRVRAARVGPAARRVRRLVARRERRVVEVGVGEQVRTRAEADEVDEADEGRRLRPIGKGRLQSQRSRRSHLRS